MQGAPAANVASYRPAWGSLALTRRHPTFSMRCTRCASLHVGLIIPCAFFNSHHLELPAAPSAFALLLLRFSPITLD
ncbi:hypothetical protein DENSPDRAFT_536593 [Dentipellis sp. KUC8613]|nr:hypothetical protein DENSPDRAFT_536593 [Dentipellis sp. KUC8613]